MKLYHEFLNEEYEEFKKTGDVFNFANYIITKDNWHEILRDLRDFLIIGDWYRIRFTEHKNVVIRLSGHHSVMTVPAEAMKYYQRSFTINFDRQYSNGEIRDPDPKYQAMVAMGGNGVFWFGLRTNRKHNSDIISYAKDDERIYYINWENNRNTIIELLERPNIIRNVKADPYGEEEWD